MTRCYGDHLLDVARAHCRDEADAQDAVQDALLSAVDNLDSYRGDGSVEGWLIRIVVNACRRMHRGQRNDPKLHVPGDDLVLPSEQDDPEMAALRAEVAGLIGAEINALPPVDRAVFLLAEGAGWTGVEIAKSIDLTPGAVRTRLTRARARLRERVPQSLAHVYG